MTYKVCLARVNPSRWRIPGVGVVPRNTRFVAYQAEDDFRAFETLTEALTYLAVNGWSGKLIKVVPNGRTFPQGEIEVIGIVEPPPLAADNTYTTPEHYLKGIV